jgi:2-phosphosulfolactate phosphatase
MSAARALTAAPHAGTRVSVSLSPEQPVAVPRGATAVVIDVLRATTTLTVARLHGAARVVPAGSPEQARALAMRHPGALLCGERDGRKIAGFDLGNSPFEYPFERVAGKTLVFASTNGSLAMARAARARRVLLAAFVNAHAVVEALAGARDVVVLCAGKLGGFALEDAGCAGLIAAQLEARGATLDDDGARCARDLAPSDADEVRTLVEGASHARYLVAMGEEFARDVDYCAGLDTLDRVFGLA